MTYEEFMAEPRPVQKPRKPYVRKTKHNKPRVKK